MIMPVWLWPEAALTLYRTFGWRALTLRCIHELRRLFGHFRRMPAHPVSGLTGSSGQPWTVVRASFPQSTDRTVALSRAERVIGGEYEAFRWDWRRLPDRAQDWHREPLGGCVWPSTAVWWKVRHLPPMGDIKDLWEPARFAWAYDLIRGFLLTGDDRFAAAFHDRLQQWVAENPPFLGAHWSCGQETAIRAVALLYAEANLAEAPSNTPEARTQLQEILAASGERIADAIGYAVSQRNNHAISEAAGLVVLGVRFRGQHPEADQWLRRGASLLDRLVTEQFAHDGWYVQHSFTYMRLALDQCVIAERALRSVGRRLASEAVSRLLAAVDLLASVIHPETGEVPNHGPNDGAFVHPVTLAAYRDFRPVLTSVCAMFCHPYPANLEMDMEVLTWLGVASPPVGPALGDGVRTGRSGWAAGRVGKMVVFLRAGEYRSRPGHSDCLHLDIRMACGELVVDPGTYAYNRAGIWRNGLAGARVHNGPIVDGREPGIRGPRFLWFVWPSARIVRASFQDGVVSIEAEARGETRRVVQARRDRVRVQDEVLRGSAKSMEVTWLLHPDASPGVASVDVGCRVDSAQDDDVLGWFSAEYGHRVPSRFIHVRHNLSTDPERRVVTEFTCG